MDGADSRELHLQSLLPMLLVFVPLLEGTFPSWRGCSVAVVVVRILLALTLLWWLTLTTMLLLFAMLRSVLLLCSVVRVTSCSRLPREFALVLALISSPVRAICTNRTGKFEKPNSGSFNNRLR